MTTAKKYTEEELVSLLRMRDEGGFNYLYDNYAAAINAVITRMINDEHLAEDILQEAYVKIWNNFNQYDPSKGRLFTWMVNLTRNLTIDKLRSKDFNKARKISTNENPVSNYRDNDPGEKYDTIGVRKEIANLKPELKQVIDMAYFYGYTQEQISKEMGLPLGTVKTRLRTALQELRKIFHKI